MPLGAGILILGSAMVIWGLAFILGLQCGIEGAYFSRSVAAPAQSGVFSAWYTASGGPVGG
jgi:phospholipid/cholesterol/gamma-HCH transport system permease protein